MDVLAARKLLEAAEEELHRAVKEVEEYVPQTELQVTLPSKVTVESHSKTPFDLEHLKRTLHAEQQNLRASTSITMALCERTAGLQTTLERLRCQNKLSEERMKMIQADVDLLQDLRKLHGQ